MFIIPFLTGPNYRPFCLEHHPSFQLLSDPKLHKAERAIFSTWAFDVDNFTLWLSSGDCFFDTVYYDGRHGPHQHHPQAAFRLYCLEKTNYGVIHNIGSNEDKALEEIEGDDVSCEVRVDDGIVNRQVL